MNRSGPFGLMLVGVIGCLFAALPLLLDVGLSHIAPAIVQRVADFGAPVAPFFGMAGLVAGMVGFGWWFHQSRSEAEFQRYEADLSRLASEFGKKIWIKPSLGIGFNSGTGGVKVDIRINPVRRFVLVYADRYPKAHFYAMVPKPGGKPPRGWSRLGGSEKWEMFTTDRVSGRQLYGDFAFRDAMDELFGSLPVQIVRHDDDGIEVVADIVDPGRAEGIIRRALKGVYWLAENNTAPT